MAASEREKPRVVVIAGPNGAGKTTFAEDFLPREAHCTEFINADLIARGLSPFDPGKAAYQASKIMLTEINSRIARRKTFAFETTLSGRIYAEKIKRWRKSGYHVKIVFLSLPTVALTLARIRSRVAQGGHDVPEADVRRRFDRGLKNFEAVYKKLVDAWILYDNSGTVPVVLDSGDNP